MQVINDNWAQELVDCIHFLHQKGFAPATSSNYSFREKGEEIPSVGEDGGEMVNEEEGEGGGEGT